MRLVGERYELRNPLAHGPHGTVWRARDQSTGQHVAVKVLDRRFASDPHVVDRFLREETVLAAFVHPGYVRVYQLLLDDDYLALVMELVPGVDLERHLRQSPPLSPETAARVAAECARMVGAGHRLGVVHGDLKPSNVLLVGKDRQVRVTDCRVALLVRGRLVGPGRFADPRYAAPEVIGNHPVAPATDVYGIGLLLFAMLTGRAMWEGVDVADPLRSDGYRRRLRQDVDDEGLRVVIDACLAMDPDRRPSAGQLAAALVAPAPPELYMPAPEDTVPAPEAFRRPGARPASPMQPPALPAAGPSPPAAGRAVPRLPTLVTRPDRRTDPRAAGARTLVARLIRPGVLAVALALATVTAVATSGLPGRNGGTVGPGAGSSGTGAGPAIASTVASTSLAAPRLPGEAAGYTTEGARSVGQYWFDALNYAVATGHTDTLRAASDPACDACTAVGMTITDAYRAGGSMRGGQYLVRSINLDSFFNLQRATFRVVYDRSPRTRVDAAGQEREFLAGATFAPCQIILRYGLGQWRVLAVQASNPIG